MMNFIANIPTSTMAITRYVLPLIGALLLASIPSSPASAQQIQAAMASAKYEALQRAGTMDDPLGAGEMAARAIYVKLRPGQGGTNPSATAARLASRAGLRTVSTSPLAFSTIPLDKNVERQLQSLSGERRRRAMAAQENLSRLVEVSYDAPMSPHDAARLMAALPEVEYAEPIIFPYPLGGGASAAPNDPMVSEQFHLEHLKFLQAWDVWKGDTNTVIGIVDAGIDRFHEDLAPNIKENAGEVGLDAQSRDKRTNKVDDDNNGVIDDWRGANLSYQFDATEPGDTRGSSHGTEVSGLAAATTNNNLGVAGAGYKTMFFPIKAAPNNDGRLIFAYEGIVYSARRGFKVINCSFGNDTYSAALQDVITGVTETFDCAIVAAAGNDHVYKPFYPAGYKYVLGVAALETDNTLRTAWGEQVDISSTGGFATGNNGAYYSLGAATSYAAPLVSGVVALVRSKYPNLSGPQALAHVRLATDAVYPPTPDMAKLTGYGRLNALKAVTIDPFSRPAIVVDTLWLTDENGNVRDRIPTGGKGKLVVRLTNLLGPASNLTVRAITYRDDSTAVSISKLPVTMASLGTEETKAMEVGIPFELKLPASNRIRVRFEITADGGYSDYVYDRVLFYQPYITVRTPNISLTLTDRGRLGYEDYPNNEVGNGFTYEGSPFLYEGGLIVAKDRAHLMTNIRSGTGSAPESDFALIEVPSEDNNNTLTIDDGPAGSRRIGLEMRIRPVILDTVPDGIGIEVRTKNLTPGVIDTVRLAYFMDWDMDSTAADQSVNFVERPGQKVPYYGRLNDQSGYYITHGVAGPALHPIFYAINNKEAPIKIDDGFTGDEKWVTVNSGIGVRSAVADEEGDISMVIGKRIVNLPAFGEDTTFFVFGFSSIGLDDAVSSMNRMVPNRQTGTGGVTEGSGLAAMLLGNPRPNPFRGDAVIEISAGARNATLRVYDAAGRMVADLTGQLDREDGSSRAVLEGSSLPNGVYRIQFVSPAGSESRQLVLTR